MEKERKNALEVAKEAKEETSKSAEAQSRRALTLEIDIQYSECFALILA